MIEIKETLIPHSFMSLRNHFGVIGNRAKAPVMGFPYPFTLCCAKWDFHVRMLNYRSDRRRETIVMGVFRMLQSAIYCSMT